MKNLLICILTIAFIGCKKETKKGTPELFRGEFIYTADASVIKGENFIYGVEIGPMVEKLSQQVAPLKREDFDMVPVVIMGIKKPNPNKEGWDEIIEITEIIGVTPPVSKLPTKINATGGSEGQENLLSTPPKLETPPIHDHSGHGHSH